MARLQRLHQIPCTRCRFYSGNAYLKCPVQPLKALSEEALDCLDFEPGCAQPTLMSSKQFKEFAASTQENL